MRAATPPTVRERFPLLGALGRGKRGTPGSCHPWSRRLELRGRNSVTAGGWEATLSAARTHWKPPRHFPERAPRGGAGTGSRRRRPGPASQGAAQLALRCPLQQ